jgi:LacI family transcriptional regulator
MTVREIARLAGVSVATVSRVYNGVGQVAPQTRQKVLDAIEATGYRPDPLGQALAAGRHGAVGLVFPGLSGPYFAELIQGFESEAVRSRSSVHILCTHLRDDSEAQVIEMARRVDGVAVLGGTVADEALAKLADLVPVVVMAGDAPDRATSIRTENRDVSAALTAHLLVHHELRDLIFVGDPDGSPDVRERYLGFTRAHEALGLTAAEPLRVAMQSHDGARATGELLDRGDRPGALVCANDEIAFGALVAALGRGLRVPGDLVLTGFDDAPMAALTSPPLTTVRQPVRELAARAAAMLLGTGPAEDVLLPTELIVRASCGCGRW